MKYPTDEELLRLIEELEAEPLFAPPHLKDAILDEIGHIAPSPSGQKAAWWQGNVAYNLKMIAGMAAALVLIFILPLDFSILGWQEQAYEQRIEAAEERYGSGQEGEEAGLREENEISRLFRIGTAAINDTNRMIVDKLNIFDGFFETRGEQYESFKEE